MYLMQKSNSTKPSDNFKLGQFKVRHLINDEKVNIVIDPLTQNDLADDWRLVLPKRHKTSTRHHFNIFLAQLPFYLWDKLFKENNEYYREIKDNIYYYSVKVSDTDHLVFRLYDLLHTQDYRVHLDEINKLYSSLYKDNVRGCLMIKAKNLLF